MIEFASCMRSGRINDEAIEAGLEQLSPEAQAKIKEIALIFEALDDDKARGPAPCVRHVPDGSGRQGRRAGAGSGGREAVGGDHSVSWSSLS